MTCLIKMALIKLLTSFTKWGDWRMKHIPLLTVPSVEPLCFSRSTKQTREADPVWVTAVRASCGRSSLGQGSDVKAANGVSRSFRAWRKGLEDSFFEWKGSDFFFCLWKPPSNCFSVLFFLVFRMGRLVISKGQTGAAGSSALQLHVVNSTFSKTYLPVVPNFSCFK